MDFSDRKCCEDGLGTKKSLSYYRKMAVQMILNLSVFNFSLFWTGEKDPRSFSGRTDRQTGGGGQTSRQAKADRQTDEVA